MLRPNTFALTVLLAALTGLGPLSTDMYLPSLPDIAQRLEASTAQTQLTISTYLVGFAIAQLVYGPIADRIGRKPVFIYGALSSAVLMPFYMLSMSSGNAVLTFALAVAVFSFGYAAANAVWPSFYGEMFSTNVRFSGMAIGTQIGFLLAGFAPSIVTALGGVREGGWVVISIFTAVVCVIAAISASTAKETKDVPTELLGAKWPESKKILVNG